MNLGMNNMCSYSSRCYNCPQKYGCNKYIITLLENSANGQDSRILNSQLSVNNNINTTLDNLKNELQEIRNQLNILRNISAINIDQINNETKEIEKETITEVMENSVLENKAIKNNSMIEMEPIILENGSVQNGEEIIDKLSMTNQDNEMALYNNKEQTILRQKRTIFGKKWVEEKT